MSEATKPAPYVVEMLMLDGTPDGIRRISIDNWNGTGLAFSRYDTARAVKRPEMERSGVYLLAGRSQDDESLPSLYIGESDSVGYRVSRHASASDPKEFWESTVAFTSPDLNKAHSKWLEARLIELASEADRVNLENKTAGYGEGLSEVEQAKAGTFLGRLLLALPLLGIDAFQSSDQQPESGEGVAVRYADFGFDAKGIWSADGLRILAGSTVRSTTVPSSSKANLRRRQALLDSGTLVPDGDLLRFTADHLFSTPSGASQMCYGGPSNGWRAWKTEDGHELWESVNRETGQASDEKGPDSPS